MSHWSQNPGQGHLGQVVDFGSTQGRRASNADGVSSRLSDIAGGEAAASWQSGSSTAWQERITRVYPTLDAAAQLARSWRGAADTYHRSVEWIQSQEAAAHHLIDSAHHTIVAYQNLPGEVAGNPTVQAKLQQCEADINHGYATLYSLRSQRSQVDRDFAQALNTRGTLDGHRDWAALEGLYGDAKSVSDIREARVAAIAEASRLADAVEGLSPDLKDIDALAGLLDAMASDPTLAGGFWAGRGGEDPLALMQKGLQQHMSSPDGLGFLSDEDEAAALAFARSIRDSLAAGSTTWDESTARDFAARMVTGGDWPGGTGFKTGTYQGVGFLFDDAASHPMGELFTVATAGLIDAVERPAGPDGVPRGTSWGDPAASSAYYEAIARADEVDRGAYEDGFAPSRDPMGRVLDTLAVYPDAAWEWLSADGSVLVSGELAAASDKVDFYASRDWTADGWDGFGSLWESSMGATDGLMSGTCDEAKWMQIGDVANRVMEGLVSGQPDPFNGDALSDAGAASLGLAAAHLMPWTETNLYSPITTDDRTGTLGQTDFYEREYPGYGNTWTPKFDSGMIGHFWGVVGGKDAGLATIQAGIDVTSAAHFAEANATNTTEAWERAFESNGALQGTLAGSVGGVDILQARYEDEVMRQRIALASEIAGLVPIPGLDEAPKMVGFAVDQAIGAGWDAASDAAAGREGASTGNFFSNQDVVANEAERFIRQMAADDKWNFGTLLPPDSDELNFFVSEARGEVAARYGNAGMEGSH
ncbi:MAG: hypothetical protein HGA51_01860 [Demequinaceae bacterium]|nr:hypothetical protein [Demequinaceae bacterium]